ncbi:MAG: DUF748 domain-containing protein [Bacteroidales bacterium]
MKRLFKILIWFGGIIFILVIGVVFLISPIARYLIEKNGEELTGRQLKLDELSINLLNGHIALQGFVMMEADKNTPFVSCDTLRLDLALARYIFSSKLYINYINISHLTATIQQNGQKFNFDDILEKFSSTDTIPSDTAVAEPFIYFIHNISLKNGHFIYRDQQIGSEIEVINAGIFTPQLAWDKPDMSYDFSFALQSKGKVDGNFSFVTETMDYLMTLRSKALNLSIINPYLKGYMNVTAFEADLDTDLKLKGNFNKPSAIAVSGNIALNNFLLADKNSNKTLGWDRLLVEVDSLNTAGEVYNMSNIALSAPYVLFEMYDKGGNNFYELLNMSSDSVTETIVGHEVPAVESANPFRMLVDLIGEMTREYIISDYNIDRLSITGGTILYRDYSLEDKFQYEMEDLSLESEGIKSESERVTATLRSKLNRLGKLEMMATLNPRDFTNMELICRIENAPVPDFSPYSKYYVAHPFRNGRVSFTSENRLVNNFLTSNNSLSIAKMEVGKKIKRKDAMNVPLRLAVSLLKDIKGNIRLEVPVEGDLNNPEYKIRKAVWGIVENILIKAATAPFRLLASTFGGNEEELKELRFEYLSTGYSPSQLKTLEKLADILIAKPELTLEVTQTAIKGVEKEHLAVYEAKRKFLLQQQAGTDSLTPAGLKQLADLSLKDSLFNAFLDQQLKLSPGNTDPPLLKCINFCGKEYLELQVNNNFTRREAYLSDYFRQKKQVPADRVRFLPVDEKNITPETQPRMIFNIVIQEEE